MEHDRDTQGRFTPGTSGNPSGRPPGIKDKRVTIREEWLGPMLPEAIEKLHAAINFSLTEIDHSGRNRPIIIGIYNSNCQSQYTLLCPTRF